MDGMLRKKPRVFIADAPKYAVHFIKFGPCDKKTVRRFLHSNRPPLSPAARRPLILGQCAVRRKRHLHGKMESRRNGLWEMTIIHFLLPFQQITSELRERVLLFEDRRAKRPPQLTLYDHEGKRYRIYSFPSLVFY